MIEIWRDIKGFEGLYEVSNFGRVKKIYRNGRIKFITQEICKGYLRVHLWKDGKSKHYLVHRLVAEAFIPNPEKKPCVGHLKKLPNGKEDKTANEVWNLEWMTYEENNNYGTRSERSSDTQKNDRGKSYMIDQYTLDGLYITTYPSSKEIKRQLGLDPSNILKCCDGIYKQSYGFIWKKRQDQQGFAHALHHQPC